jgi:hypothetical protein
MKLKTHNMAHKQRTPFTLKSGNKTSFKAMGSSPMRLSQLSPEMMKAQEMKGKEMRSKMIANGRREHAEMMEAHKKGAGSSGSAEAQALRAQARAQQGLNTTGGSSQAQIDLFNQANKAVPQGPNTMRDRPMPTQQYDSTKRNAEMQRQATATPISQQYDGTKPLASKPIYDPRMLNAQAPALTPEQKFALSSTSVRTPVGASRPPAQANTPRVAVQSAPRPDLSGGPRQPMGRPMGAPRQPMGGLGQPMGGPGFGGPGQLPPNKGRRKPGMGPGMGRARRATGLARRARRATGLARRVRRSRG